MVPSNITAMEFIKYYSDGASKEEYHLQFLKLIDRLEKVMEETAQDSRRVEILEEQVGFARDLVTNLQEQAVTSFKEARKNSKEWHLANFVINEIENSYFEL